MKIEVNITKTKLFVMFIGLFAIIGAIFAFAYGDFSSGDATTFGHSADELMVKLNGGGYATVQSLLQDGLSSGSGSSGFLVTGSGDIPFSSTDLNLGSDWDLVILGGQYSNSDASPAGGFISNEGGVKKVNVYVATSGKLSTILNSTYQCMYPMGSSGVVTAADYCVKLSNNNLLIKTGSSIQLKYVKIKNNPTLGLASTKSWTDSGALTPGKIFTIAHGFSNVPVIYKASIVKVVPSTSDSYNVGDEIGSESLWQWPNSYNSPITIYSNSSSITAQLDGSGGLLLTTQKGTIDNAHLSSWRLKITAIGN